jgi:hypothetical protein
MYTQTDVLIEHFRKVLTLPLGYSPPKDDPDSLVEAQVLPDDIRKSKLFLNFHVDRDSRGDKRYPILSAHLRYRHRPPGPIPPLLKTLRAAGSTIGWVERAVLSLGDPTFFVEAELEVPSEERPGARIAPPVSVGGSTLKKCGEEYSAGRTVIGQVAAFRWRESGSANVRLWLTYSHQPVEHVAAIWDDEERRCQGLLQQLV